ncbi:hypothetical protein CAAN3_13S01816 [[Candida] anglica]
MTDVQLVEDLTRLFVEERFYDIVLLMPALGAREIPTGVRLVLAATLFQLGRVASGMRELALAIELANDWRERRIVLQYLAVGFAKLGKVSERDACLVELGELKEGHLTRETAEDFNWPLYERSRDSRSLPLTVSVPLHVQARGFLSSHGNLDDYSLGRRCIHLDQMARIALSPEALSLCDLFKMFKYFGPLYFYDDLLKPDSLLERQIHQEMLNQPDLDFNNDGSPAGLSLSLTPLLNEISPVTSLSRCSSVIKLQVVRGFLLHLQQSHSRAMQIFQWVLHLFEEMESKLPATLFNCNEYYNPTTKRVVSLLMVSSANLADDTSVDYDQLIATLVACSHDMNISSEYSSGRLCQYFLCCGGLYEKLSYIKAVDVNIEEDPRGGAVWKRLSPVHVEEMVRKYIIAATLKPRDDPSVIFLYQRILWGVLVHGGLHLQVLWFFKFVRDHFFIDLEYGPLSYNDSARYRDFPGADQDILTHYDNGHHSVDNICALRNSLSDLEIDTMWDDDHAATFLMPQVFVSAHHRRLVFADSYYDERMPYVSTRDFVSTSHDTVKPKLKGQLKLNSKLVNSNIATSKVLIDLWVDSYSKYHGSIPLAILEKFGEKVVNSSGTPVSEEASFSCSSGLFNPC